MISTTSEYALRALVVLAGQGDGRCLQARELARETGISSSYLYKILATLRRAGVLSGARGNRGGYSLGRDPAEIRLIDVVSLFELVRSSEACLLSENHPCDDANPCSAHEHWREVQRSYQGFLKSKTIADLSVIEAAG
jgi:Rrf2 family protein